MQFATDTLVEFVKPLDEIVIEKKPDTMFLGLLSGLSEKDYSVQIDSLIRVKKIKKANNKLIYGVQVRNDYLLKDLLNKDRIETVTIENGFITPQFFNGDLVSISIKFINPKTTGLYFYLNRFLNDKYYDSYDIIDFENVADSIRDRHFYNTHWNIGDMEIILAEKRNNTDKDIRDIELRYNCLGCLAKMHDINNKNKDLQDESTKADL